MVNRVADDRRRLLAVYRKSVELVIGFADAQALIA
jgi:hypothetical protein